MYSQFSSITIFIITLTLLSPSSATTTATAATATTTTASAAGSSENPTVYELLQSYDFPIGLLPVGVKSYEVDQTTGKFGVHLDQDCSYTIEGYELKYKSSITGTIARDKLTNLSGIQVKILFLWLSIVEVSRDHDELQLSVGFASANFPMDNFYVCPQCGCGFDCLSKIEGKLVSTLNNGVSS